MSENASFVNCLNKQAELELLFKDCPTPDEKYQRIIYLGRKLAPYPIEYKIPGKIVSGCQSIMYLHAYFENEKMHFMAHSEALISAGLAALLIKAYDQEPPEVVLKCPPLFLEKIGIAAALSPSRSNGLASFFLKMKRESLNYIL
ncbi:MAG TPA: SufE family protein [Rhabdochlamydiaceae bacterium]|jgi:cysteine desulfuration protein SufE